MRLFNGYLCGNFVQFLIVKSALVILSDNSEHLQPAMWGCNLLKTNWCVQQTQMTHSPAPEASTVNVAVLPRKALDRPVPLAVTLVASELNLWMPLNLVVVLVLVTVSTTTDACSCVILALPWPSTRVWIRIYSTEITWIFLVIMALFELNFIRLSSHPKTY